MSCPEIITGRVSSAFGIGFAENREMLAGALALSDSRMYRNKTEKKRAKSCMDPSPLKWREEPGEPPRTGEDSG
jgi:hypothetical protein